MKIIRAEGGIAFILCELCGKNATMIAEAEAKAFEAMQTIGPYIWKCYECSLAEVRQVLHEMQAEAAAKKK